MTGLQLFFVHTRVGTAMRAVMEDRETAGLMGVRVKSMIALSFAISGIFAAVAGVVIAPITNVSFDMGLILIKVFVAAVIGGLYSIPGAVAGGLLLGVMENFTTSYISSNYRDVIVYSLLILGLLFKPAGLFAWRRAN
jgi:branched-chain amino acid transport system permease protein